jgi:ribonuclease BN (tRNA processing enzyme)
VVDTSGRFGGLPEEGDLRLTVVGCTGSFPGPDSPASCYLLDVTEAGRTWRVVLDLGSGSLGPLQRYAAPSDLDAVVISHLHPDHFMDLCGLYVALRYDPAVLPGAAALPVYGPEHTFQRIQQAYGPDAIDELPKVYDVRTMADGQPFAVGPIRITPRRVEHPVPAFGLRIEYAGRSIAYSGDTDACPELLELARDVDLLLAEASFEEGRDAVRGIHLTGRRAGEVARQAGARRLVLTHIPVWTDPKTALAEAVEVYPGPVETARPGAGYRIGVVVPN